MSANPSAFAGKRRTSRIEKAIPLAVEGLDVFRSPYREDVTTQTLSYHGCAYRMKHEVLPGDVVILDMSAAGAGQPGTPNKARVRWVHKLRTMQDQVFDVGVEFENGANVWALPAPPEDWLRAIPGSAPDGSHGRDLQIVPRPEPQLVSAKTPTGGALAKPAEAQMAGAVSLPDLMAGLGSQIQQMVSQTAAVSLAQEKNRLLSEFRAELQVEADATMQRVLATAKDVLARRALKELHDTLEAGRQSEQERWKAAIEQDLQKAKERMEIQSIEVSQRIDNMATCATERLQRSLETTRAEAAARFVSRLREQVEPLLEGAKGDLQKLAESQNTLKEQSHEIQARLAADLEAAVAAKLKQAQDDLAVSTAVVIDQCNHKLVELSSQFEKGTRESLESLVTSAVDAARQRLEQRTAEIGGNFTTRLEDRTRGYLESISASLTEITNKTSIGS